MKPARAVLAVIATVATWVPAASRPQPAAPATPTKIPVTTASAAARQEYLLGRDLLEKLRAADARVHFQKAAALDPGCALAAYGLALSAPTAADFFAALRSAVALAPRASGGEARMIRALEAQANGRPETAREELTALVTEFPDDARAHNLLGQYFFGRQQWREAIAEYGKATAIDPNFSQPYNQLGYALRFLERWDEAERAFKTYVDLIPGEPNPYDSYAELLMKRGRFADSIVQYRKALEVDPHFVASYIGIANDQIFLGTPAEARLTLAKLAAIARNDGERRQAHFWTAVAYLHEGNATAALAEIERMQAIADQANDRVAVAGDLALMGTILLEAGQADAARVRFEAGVAAIDASDAGPDVKETAHRNALANAARVALARKDIAAAARLAEQYRQQVATRQVPFEVWQTHEIDGLVAAARADYAAAVRELEQANQQDPRVLLALGKAYAAAGDAKAAQRALTRAANFNGLAFNYAFVRTRATSALAH